MEALRAEHSNMTVIVATAYIEEAQRGFEHLVAMDAGKVLVCDRTANVSWPSRRHHRIWNKPISRCCRRHGAARRRAC
ncbi:hypothetical protein ACU4GD_16650 [Cupriavidus basilensis]